MTPAGAPQARPRPTAGQTARTMLLLSMLRPLLTTARADPTALPGELRDLADHARRFLSAPDQTALAGLLRRLAAELD